MYVCNVALRSFFDKVQPSISIQAPTQTDTMTYGANLAHLTSRRLAATFNFVNATHLIILTIYQWNHVEHLRTSRKLLNGFHGQRIWNIFILSITQQ